MCYMAMHNQSTKQGSKFSQRGDALVKPKGWGLAEPGQSGEGCKGRHKSRRFPTIRQAKGAEAPGHGDVVGRLGLKY